MINNNVTKELPIYWLNFDSTHFKYSYYVIDKSIQLLFKKTNSIIKNHLFENLKLRDKIHSDQVKPIILILYSENQFLIIFIDVGSRIVFIYFITIISEINKSKTIRQEEEQHVSFKTQIELIDNLYSY
jgi:hypothetical protein